MGCLWNQGPDHLDISGWQAILSSWFFVISGGNCNDSQDCGFASAVCGDVVASVCSTEEAVEVVCAEGGAHVRRKEQRRGRAGNRGRYRRKNRGHWVWRGGTRGCRGN